MYLCFQNILTKNTSVPEIQKRLFRSSIWYSSILYSGGFCAISLQRVLTIYTNFRIQAIIFGLERSGINDF